MMPNVYFKSLNNGICNCFSEIAWDIITDFASELLEKEQADEITEILDRKRKETLEKKRSFFVRMVSDPKIYNPAINKAGPGTPRLSSDTYSPIAEGTPTIQTPSKYALHSSLLTYETAQPEFIHVHFIVVYFSNQSSWISWPLAFLFASSDDGPKSNVPIR